MKSMTKFGLLLAIVSLPVKRTTKLSLWLALVSLPLGVVPPAAVAREGHECTWNGTVTSVDAQDKIVTAKGWVTTKTFNIGAKCAFTTADKHEAELADVHPGDRVRVRYLTSGGVHVADRIDERLYKERGTVEEIDPKTGAVTLEAPGLNRVRLNERYFHAANDCKVVQANGKSGSLDDVRRGDTVTVVYEMSNKEPMAYNIDDHSFVFTGRLEAADIASKTVKAGDKSFSLADDCRIVVPGENKAKMNALQLGQDYTITFHELNGINVADRVSLAPRASASQSSSSAPKVYGANY